MKMKKAILVATFGGIFIAFSASPSFAACSIGNNYQALGGLKGWNTRIENSENAALRTGYANGTCILIKGAHTGGTIPANALDSLHVTVAPKSGATACHVFRKKSTAIPTDGFPTTC